MLHCMLHICYPAAVQAAGILRDLSSPTALFMALVPNNTAFDSSFKGEECALVCLCCWVR